MELKTENVKELISNINAKNEFTIILENSVAGLNNDINLVTWKEFSPALLSKKEYCQILWSPEYDLSAIWMKAHLCTYLQGGIVEYQEKDENHVYARIKYNSIKLGRTWLEFVGIDLNN